MWRKRGTRLRKRLRLSGWFAVAAGNAKARAKDDLATVQDALVIAEEARIKVETHTTRLEVEQTSLLLEIGEAKDEVSYLQSQAGKDKAALNEDY